MKRIALIAIAAAALIGPGLSVHFLPEPTADQLVAPFATISASFDAYAVPTAGMTDQGKKDYLDGMNVTTNAFAVMFLTSASTAWSGSTTIASISGAEVASFGSNASCTGSGSPIACCTGTGTGNCVYTAGGTGYPLSGRSSSISANHACVTWNNLLFSATPSQVRAMALVNPATSHVLSIHCTDGTASGSPCAADTTNQGGTLGITMPSGLNCVN
jgi:hypothetical protein